MQRRVLLVTGASGGIGAATARLAGARGYAVCVHYHGGAKRAEAVATTIRSSGGEAIAVQADVSDEAAVARMYDRIDSKFGRLDGLFNNAGITGPMRLVETLEAATLRRVLETNVVGCFLVAREALLRMSTSSGGQGGSIVNMSSRAAQLGGGGEWVHYAASKGAIDSFTLGLAKEAAGNGVRVNAVAPGLIQTDIHARAGAGDRVQRLLPNVPMGRIGTPEEVAEVVLWLLSDAASYVSGTIVPISGGR